VLWQSVDFQHEVSAVDAVDGPVPVTCAPASGSIFPLGTTTVACTATDAAGNMASASFRVTVVDTIPQTSQQKPRLIGRCFSSNSHRMMRKAKHWAEPPRVAFQEVRASAAHTSERVAWGLPPDQQLT
jgi:hypothetical protein